MESDKQDLLQFAGKIGFDVGEHAAQHIEVKFQKTYGFLPELAVFIASYVVKKTFTRQTTGPKHITGSIRFFFHNLFDDDEATTQKNPPYVRIFPSALPHTSLFKKNSRVKVVSVIISANYLKSFLANDVERFQFLFGSDDNFLIEEIMTDDILRTVNDMVKKEEPAGLKSYYYKLKAMELLYYLFQSLGRREKSVRQKLSENDIRSIYQIRDKLLSSLQKPISVKELQQIAGMNELKMRRIFTQIFGMGIYDYFQYFRMKEAARLLREEKLSVSEAGYQMGFENLSHFTRIFEKHIGKKPKRYSIELT
ncbi:MULTISPECIES: helix-turn-helix domain-containing protein [Chitinophagaceae]